MTENSGEQTLICEGCGSKYLIIQVKSRIVARVVECPLCENIEEA